MRIAFVGKGGSGKSTVTALFSMLSIKKSIPVTIFDADINIHIPHLLQTLVSPSKYISKPENTSHIKKYLIGNNNRIQSTSEFRKSTPPARGSNFFVPESKSNPIFELCGTPLNERDALYVVGTYEKEHVGTSCYHGSLAIFENILSHTIDTNSIVIADMVAGIDSFSNTLHAQFDILAHVVEPTSQSLDVVKRYLELAENSGVRKHVKIIANKVEDDEDIAFIERELSTHVDFVIYKSKHIRDVNLGKTHLSIDSLENNSNASLEKLYDTLLHSSSSLNDKYKKVIDIHKKYIQKDFITERHGDISRQIDPDFSFF